MTQRARCLFTTCVLLGFAAGCATQKPQPAEPTSASVIDRAPGRVEQANVVTTSAIVDHIDREKRLVTVRTADGKETRLYATSEVRNLDQVDVGDEVVLSYVQSVAIAVQKGDGELGSVGGEVTFRAPKGEKPAAATARTLTITAKIVAIDRADSEVTLEDADGKRTTLEVKYPAHFDVIAVGDLVDITYTEALAVSVQPAPAK